MPEYREGQTAGGGAYVYQGGKWRSTGGAPAGATPRPDYAPGAYQTKEGDVLAPGRQGPKVMRSGGQGADASMRSRLDLGMAPMVQAQEDMSAIEAKGNPFSLRDRPDNALAKTMTDVELPWIGGHPLEGIGKAIGGEDFQKYHQAASAFEAQLMPIMSGAAVSPSEGRRQVRASLPEVGDSPATLKAKARDRRMLLNGAAKAMGVPPPYPAEPTYGVNTTSPPTSGQLNDPLGIRSR